MYELEWIFYYTSIAAYSALSILIFYHFIAYVIRKINKRKRYDKKINDLNGDDYVI